MHSTKRVALELAKYTIRTVVKYFTIALIAIAVAAMIIVKGVNFSQEKSTKTTTSIKTE